MKLIGSVQEKQFREDLLMGYRYLFKTKGDPRLLAFFEAQFPPLETAYFLEHFPDQDKDTFTFLVNGSVVVKLEADRIDRGREPVLLSTRTLDQYLKGLKKIDRVRLAVALDLSRIEVENREIRVDFDGK
jgi:hypothetical protein